LAAFQISAQTTPEAMTSVTPRLERNGQAVMSMRREKGLEIRLRGHVGERPCHEVAEQHGLRDVGKQQA
jgi:hypothetical protein